MSILTQVLDRPRSEDLSPAALWRNWRYTGGKRDLRLDFLRGFAAFAMIVDHVSGDRSYLYLITGGDAFYASAAEAFVFISGLVMGIVYRGIIDRQGGGAALTKSLKRAWTLYTLTIFLTLSFAATSSLLNLPWALHLTAREVPGFVVGALTLHQTFHLADVLLMYTFLVAGAGPLIVLLARGQTRWVLTGSWGLWLLWQIWPAQAQIPWAIDGNEVFKLAAWQAIFVTAMVIGYHRRALERRLARLAPWAVLLASALVLIVAAVLYFDVLGSPYVNGTLAAELFAKPDLRFGRVFVFAGAFGFAFALTTVAWMPLRRMLGWLLMPLGHYALTAYALHIFVVAALWKSALFVLGGNRSAMENTLIQLTGVAIVWAAIVLWPEAASLVDCCVHCGREGACSVGRIFSHGHAIITIDGDSCRDSTTALTSANSPEHDVGGGIAPCGHSEPHADCP